MPQPTSAEYLDQVLTNLSVAYLQAADHFIADKVFPPVPVDKQNDRYYVYTKADWFRDEAQVRGDAAESAGSGYRLGSDTYACDVFALHKDVGVQARANSAGSPINPDEDATRFVTQRLLLRREKQWAADYFKTGVWATDKTGTTDFVKWSDYAGSDPIDDIETGKAAVLTSTGFLPNVLVCGYNVWRRLKNHPDFLDRIKHTSAEPITQELVARLLGLERVLVAMAIENTAVEGATAAYALTHGDHALLAYANPQPGLLAPSAGYIFSWRGVSAGLGFDIAISRIPMVQLKADRIEGEVAFDDKVVASDLGYFFSTAV